MSPYSSTEKRTLPHQVPLDWPSVGHFSLRELHRGSPLRLSVQHFGFPPRVGIPSNYRETEGRERGRERASRNVLSRDTCSSQPVVLLSLSPLSVALPCPLSQCLCPRAPSSVPVGFFLTAVSALSLRKASARRAEGFDREIVETCDPRDDLLLFPTCGSMCRV